MKFQNTESFYLNKNSTNNVQIFSYLLKSNLRVKLYLNIKILLSFDSMSHLIFVYDVYIHYTWILHIIMP